MNPSRFGRPAASLLFLSLSVLTLVTFGLSLSYFQRVASLHEAGVSVNGANARTQMGLNLLQSLADEMHLPASDVFLSEDAPGERKRIQEAEAAFRKQAASTRQAAAGNTALLAKLDEALAAAAIIDREAHAVVDAFEGGDLPAATRAMARMERAHTQFSDPLQQAQDALEGQEMKMFRDQQRELIRLAKQRQVIAFVLLLLVALTLIFGRRAVREMAAGQERERYLAELGQREAALTLAIAQRDQQTATLEEAQALAGVGSWEWTVATNTVSWSRALHRIVGTSPETFGGSYEDYMSRVHPEDQARVGQTIAKAMQSDTPYEVEHRMVRTDGTTITLASRGNVERDAAGNVTRMFGVAHDISVLRASQAEVQKSQERFELAARATAEVIWDWDVLANKLWIDEAWSQQFGYPSGAIEVSDWADAIHPEDADRIHDSIEALFESAETSWTGEYRMRTVAGTYREVIDRGFLVRDCDGKPVRMIGAMKDVTPRKEAERALAAVHTNMEMILKSAADGLFGIDGDGVSIFVNPAAAHMLGYEPDELLGRRMHEVIHSRDEAGREQAWTESMAFHTLADGAGRSGTSVFWSKSGRPVPVDFTATAIVDGTGAVKGAVMTFRDISERLAMDRMKDEFVSTVSHELRTPLTSIRGALGLLVSGRLGALPEKAARLLEIASTNTDRLVRLINDILDIERMESGKVTLSKAPADAADLIQQAIDLMRQPADEAGINLTVSCPSATVVVDSDRIVQTLTNLIGNAIKFSPRDSTIHVSCRRVGASMEFTVADQGRGIPRKELHSVFERFKQVDASDSRDHAGSGLGLAICKSIVRQHGGDISVRSEVGRGSEFSFTVPALPERGTEIPGIASTVFDDERLVYICDDDESAREVMAVLLVANGYRVKEFSGGNELLHAISLETPRVILLDLFMPDMNGWEALARLKSNPETAGIPVVVVSVLSPDECESPFLDLCGWLHKPLEEGELLDAVTEALRTGSRSRRMLVVEDDPDLARVIASSFQRYGLEVIVAANGQEAIDVAPTIVPDIIVLDLLLPEVDGFGVIDWIKDHDLWRGVPLVVYSAVDTTPSQQERLRLGPTEFITKSRIAPAEFEQRVLKLLGRLTDKLDRPPGSSNVSANWTSV